VVLVDRDFEPNHYDVVVSDNFQGAVLATCHLASLGHRRIACITGSMDLMSSVQRLNGFSQTMDEFGLRVDRAMIYHGDFRPDSGRMGFLRLLGSPQPPTAVFACNDMMAIGALRAAAEIGVRIPDDVAVIGFDDIALSAYTIPSLTTIAQDKGEIGRKCVLRLHELMSGQGNCGERFSIPTYLVPRESAPGNGSRIA
jgi:LacI family transcriptional regulator